MHPALILILAIILDLIVGDPPWLPHPVRWIGWLASTLEPFFRMLCGRFLRIAGVLFTLLIISIVMSLVTVISIAAFLIAPIIGVATQIALIASALAVKSLAREGWIIRRLLRQGSIKSARVRVQRIVSRNMEQENERGIIRALIETMTENVSDGVIAPLCFALIAGAPGIWFYKTINTLDSMIGYRNDHYRKFGWFAARLDDVVNYIPARITGTLIVFTALFTKQSARGSILAWIRDAQKGPSPNGGIPIVAFAGARDIQLGGNCVDQGGHTIEIPTVGGHRTTLTTMDISWCLVFHYSTTGLFLILAIFVSSYTTIAPLFR
ncbi:MAG: adenosylcobinamide-phosphate synthase CbiB [Candidatus Uhrbacteria bacterium]